MDEWWNGGMVERNMPLKARPWQLVILVATTWLSTNDGHDIEQNLKFRHVCYPIPLFLHVNLYLTTIIDCI